jgi:dCMP deaminase
MAGSLPIITDMERVSWDEYFLKIAVLVAERSTCLRRKVGAVLVREKRILATGYNGVPHGIAHCDKVGCMRSRMKLKSSTHIELCRGIHAEQNAIVQAATSGVNISGAVLYCTHEPCITCTKILINSGIKEFRVTEPYPDAFARKMLRDAGVKVQVVNRRRKCCRN